MPPALGNAAPLFASARFFGREMAADELPQLQALFEASPEYFLAINGQGPRADEARIEFDELPPVHLRCTRRAASLAAYFERVPRDRPDSRLP